MWKNSGLTWKEENTVIFINIWSSYCPTTHDHLCSWGQFFGHPLLHCNTTAHSMHSPLLPSSLSSLNRTENWFTILTHCLPLGTNNHAVGVPLNPLWLMDCTGYTNTEWPMADSSALWCTKLNSLQLLNGGGGGGGPLNDVTPVFPQPAKFTVNDLF
jgi:hypothetical protein